VDQLERALSARQQHYVNCLQRQLAVLQADASCYCSFFIFPIDHHATKTPGVADPSPSVHQAIRPARRCHICRLRALSNYRAEVRALFFQGGSNGVFCALRCGEPDHEVVSMGPLERALSARQQYDENCLQRQLTVMQADASCYCSVLCLLFSRSVIMPKNTSPAPTPRLVSAKRSEPHAYVTSAGFARSAVTEQR